MEVTLSPHWYTRYSFTEPFTTSLRPMSFPSITSSWGRHSSSCCTSPLEGGMRTKSEKRKGFSTTPVITMSRAGNRRFSKLPSGPPWTSVFTSLAASS